MGKIALISGATSGIGEATARILAKDQVNLILCGRRRERLEKLSTELQELNGTDTLLLSFDIRNSDEVEQAVQGIPEKWQAVDYLVNNAGLASGLGKIQDGDIEDWDKMIDTNVKGLLYLTRQLAPLMIKRQKGHVVNIGSIAGKEVYPGGNVYCGTKHMVDALNKAMRRELAEEGIKVTAVNPGAVETEFSVVRFHGDEKKAKKVYDGFENLLAEDIADAVHYALSRPERVNINDIIIMPKAQPAAGHVIRNKGF
jgi:3-hydroxy acid dehydrogenase/malonic semialdehyde reductase